MYAGDIVVGHLILEILHGLVPRIEVAIQNSTNNEFGGSILGH